MTELSPEAKELLRHARAAFSPPDGRLAEVRSALQTQFAVTTPSASSPASGVATRAIGAAGWGTAHSIGAAVLVGVLGAGGALAWLTADRPNSAPEVSIEAPATAVAVGELAALPVPENVPPPDVPLASAPTPLQGSASELALSTKLSTVARDRARAPTRTRSKAEASRETAFEPPARRATDPLAEEVNMLRAARAALDRGEAGQALRLLDAHETRFQHGTLYEERLATRVLSLCALGRIEAARFTAQELEHAAPRSPHLPRVRASCVAQGSTK
jgi:hypothetical protein